jgi:hypothetical protein
LTPPTQVPGLTQTVTGPANGLLLISTHGGVATLSPSTSGFSLVRLRVLVDGATVSGLDQVADPANTAGLVPGIQNWALEGTVPLAAGQHTISVSVNGTGQGDPAQVSDSAGTLQGTLTVTILNT